MAHLIANHGGCSHPGTQLGAQKKDFDICSSVAQANIVLSVCLLRVLSYKTIIKFDYLLIPE